MTNKIFRFFKIMVFWTVVFPISLVGSVLLAAGELGEYLVAFTEKLGNWFYKI